MRTAGEEDGAEENAEEAAEEAGALPLPTPRAAAVAVLAVLAFGVLIGSAIRPVTPSDARRTVLLALARPATRTTKPPPVSETPTPSTPEAPETPTPAPATTTETVSQSSTKSAQPSAGKGEGAPAPAPTPGANELPPVKHVFLIVLSDEGAPAAFGPSSPAPYLAKTLPHEGELVEDYYAIGGGELANAIALISGQGPTPQTAADCPLYTDLVPGTAGSEGQALGSGCVYPRQTLTLADQLTDAGKTWRAYMEGVETSGAGQPATGAGQPASCPHPTLGAADPDSTPAAGSAYVTWRDPFVYFHSLIDTPACAQGVAGLPQLTHDLGSARETPSFAYIAPGRCDDGSETPCAPGAPAGLAAAEPFLRKVVGEIEASAAYREGGLIAITFDQAPQSGAGADSSGCCSTTPYPNLPASTTTTTSTTTPAPATSPAPGTTSTTLPPAATPTPSGTATTPAPGAPDTQTATPGGGRVGLLLISRYVKPGTLNLTGEYNHFALLRSIENLFALQPLGYAGAKGLLAFDSSVFNAHP
ncbi:MAG TPA: hypothetical protein VID70_05140 [Solirubrobacteraceae bacterium]|jgi:hypothetical protein